MAKPSYYTKPSNLPSNPGDTVQEPTSDVITDVPFETAAPQVDVVVPEAAVAAPVAPVVTPVTAPVVTVASVQAQPSAVDRNVLHALEEYLSRMAPGKPVNGPEGGKFQYGLWLTIKNILAANDSQDFKVKYNTLLAFANKHRKGLFSENYLYRYPEHWVGSDNEFTIFRRIGHVVMNTCDNSTRAASLLEINIEKAIEGLSEKEKNNIINFYGV